MANKKRKGKKERDPGTIPQASEKLGVPLALAFWTSLVQCHFLCPHVPLDCLTNFWALCH